MMQAVRKFRENLKKGQICLGSAITFTDPLVADAIADAVDFLWIDLEHNAMSPQALSGHLLAARAHAVPAFVRVPGSGTAFIKPVLDAGADGIVVPQVRSVEEVRAVVADCRYPPLGQRGFGPRVLSNYGRNGGSEYVQAANENVLVAVMLETMEALEAIEDIVKVPGLDSIVIGPCDLSFALGVPGDLKHPKVITAFEKIAAATKAAGIFLGVGMGPDVDFARSMIKRGVQWVQFGGDFSYMVSYVDQVMTRIRQDTERIKGKSSVMRE